MGTTTKIVLYSHVFSREKAEGSSVNSWLYRLRKEVSGAGRGRGLERETLFRYGWIASRSRPDCGIRHAGQRRLLAPCRDSD